MKWTLDELRILSDCDLTFEQLTNLIPQHTLIAIKNACKTYGFPRNLVARSHGKELDDNEIQELLSGDFLQIINGHLLGDGSIGKEGIRFSLSNTQYEYIEFTQSTLNTLSHRCLLSYVDRRTKTKFGDLCVRRQQSYKAVCSCKQIFEPLRTKWYTPAEQHGRFQKVVPRDLELTPLTCNRWYADDGSLNVRPKTSKLSLYLCTDDFREEDVELLVLKLKALDINATKHKGKKRARDGRTRWSIYMGGQTVVKFLNYIGKCPVKCYDYKWNVQTYNKRQYACKHCGTTMEEWGFGDTPKKKFCSAKCCQRYFVDARTEQARKHGEKRKCVVCKEEFIAWSRSERLASNAASTCGKQECVNTLRHHRGMKTRNLLPRNYTCVICEKPCVEWTPNGQKAKNSSSTCKSNECRTEYKRRRQGSWHKEWRNQHREEFNAYMRSRRAKRAM